MGRKQEFSARSKWVGRNHLFSARLFASMLQPRDRCSIRSIPATSTASFFVPGPTAPVGEPEPVSGARWRHERPGRPSRARPTPVRARSGPEWRCWCSSQPPVLASRRGRAYPSSPRLITPASSRAPTCGVNPIASLPRQQPDSGRHLPISSRL